MTFPHGLTQFWRTAVAGSLAAQSAWLLGAVALVYLLIAPFVAMLQGADGLLVAGVAAGICLFGAFGGLAIVKPLSGPSLIIGGVVLGTFLRIVIPLVFCLIVYRQEGLLTRAGLVFYVLPFYLVTLAMDATLMALRVAHDATTSKNACNHG